MMDLTICFKKPLASISKQSRPSRPLFHSARSPFERLSELKSLLYEMLRSHVLQSNFGSLSSSPPNLIFEAYTIHSLDEKLTEDFYENSIFINFTFGMLAGMKTFLNLFCLLDHNIRREETVQGPLDRADIHLALRLEVRQPGLMHGSKRQVRIKRRLQKYWWISMRSSDLLSPYWMGLWEWKGNGPNSGRPIPIGLILASGDSLSLDQIVCEPFGDLRESLLTIEWRLNRDGRDPIDVLGEKVEDLKISNFQFPALFSQTGTSRIFEQGIEERFNLQTGA